MQTRTRNLKAQSARARPAAASALAGGSRQGAFISGNSEARCLNAAIDAQLVLAFRDGVTVLLFDGFAPEVVNACYLGDARAELRKQRASNPVTAPVIRDRLPEDRPINEQPLPAPGEVAA